MPLRAVGPTGRRLKCSKVPKVENPTKTLVHPCSSFDTSGRTLLPIMVSGSTLLTALSKSKGYRTIKECGAGETG